MQTNHLNTPFTLPCGVVLKNRLVKSAMTERISNSQLEPTERHHQLYSKWAETGAGLMITGNIVVDPVHVESNGNVYVGSRDIQAKLKAWAEVAKQNDAQVWVQISHAGRQTNRFATSRPMAPSEVQLKLMGLFGKPRAMQEADVQQVIRGFVDTAKACKAAGFTGVQLHAAHGYLLSQFLSPRTNQRTDQWGGSLENRSRLLMTLISQVREAVGPEFPLAVKLNSSDFQRGGFTEEESLEVIKMLDGKIDLLEISGGTYEKMAFFEGGEEPQMKESTRKREAYFMEFSEKVRAISQIPLLITGGFRSFAFCNEVLERGELDLVGMGRPFITNVEEIADFLEGRKEQLESLVIKTGIKAFDSAADGGFYARQLIRLADGKPVNLNMPGLLASSFLVLHEFRQSLSNRL